MSHKMGTRGDLKVIRVAKKYFQVLRNDFLEDKKFVLQSILTKFPVSLPRHFNRESFYDHPFGKIKSNRIFTVFILCYFVTRRRKKDERLLSFMGQIMLFLCISNEK